MKFDDDFFLAEDRDGFHIRSMMKRFWAVQMDILAIIDDICRRHNIRYFLYYGTLLGAVRHKGFIPWDDDTDICMCRIDYMRFIQVVKDELPEGYYLHNHNKNILCPIRIINSDCSIRCDDEFLNRNHKCPYPTGVDIFVIDNCPDDESERKLVFSIINILNQWSDSIKERKDTAKSTFEFNDYDYELMQLVENSLGKRLDNKETILEDIALLGDKVSAMYYDAPTKDVAWISYYVKFGRGLVNASCFSNSIIMPFESLNLPAPVGYKEILLSEYGDYMTPIIEYQLHEYGFGEYEKMLFDEMKKRGIKIPAYLLD